MLSSVRKPLLAALALIALVAAGCAEAPSREGIPPFRQGVVTADQQTAAAFADVNRYLRRQQIDRASRQPTLTESLFVEGLAAEDRAKWHRAFALIQDYADKLEELLAPEQRAGIQSDLADLGTQIGAVSGTQLPPGVAAGFVQLAGFLVQLRAERDALAATRKADPAIQAIFTSMMTAIGDDTSGGIRGTVANAWRQELGTIATEQFLATNSVEARRAAAVKYVAAMDERDTQDLSLNTIRLSLATLAKAHQELANGRRTSATALIKLIQDEYKAYQARVEALRKAREDAAAAGGKP